MKKKILVVVPTYDEHRAWLEEAISGYEDQYELVYSVTRETATEEEVKDASIILGSCRASLMDAAKKLEWLQLSSAGADPFAKPGVLRPEVVLTNSVGAYGLSVSEHMLALTLDMIRGFRQYAINQSAHIWKRGPNIIAVEDAVIAVLGMGNIGGDYAKKVKALGAYVIGVRKGVHEKPDYADEQYTIDELDSVLPRADIVAMVMPGGDETYHIMNEERLRLMKPGSYILNAGRGSSIDCKALKKVLKEGHLAGAGLDVTEPEPLPADDELWDLPNVTITPHVAGGFQLYLKQSRDRVLGVAASNLKRWVHGEPLENVVKH